MLRSSEAAIGAERPEKLSERERATLRALADTLVPSLAVNPDRVGRLGVRENAVGLFSAHPMGSARAGLDLEMPSGLVYGDPLTRAVRAKRLSVSTIDRMLVLRYAAMIRNGLFDSKTRPPLDPAAGRALARRAAEQGMVLLRNAGGVLPLDAAKPSSIAVIGPYASAATTGTLTRAASAGSTCSTCRCRSAARPSR